MTAATLTRTGLVCHTCHRPMRRRGTTAADHPGTVLAETNTRCRSCYERSRRRRNGMPDLHARRRAVVEDVEWLTDPANFVDRPDRIAARLGYDSVWNLLITLRRAGRDDLAQRLLERREHIGREAVA
ncbi:hypothetical protein [Jiangella gansuensis]|uniref:hypothetical protein n=1 Tax=Jiangella gansuensis TaxID=281473 RepID=UPI00047E5063|nr:hypothetical protein [Jiangella gansuensis]